MRSEPHGTQYGSNPLAAARGEGGCGTRLGRLRTFIFFPLLKEDKVKRTAAREMLDRVFGGNVGSLVAHLLKGERIVPGTSSMNCTG